MLSWLNILFILFYFLNTQVNKQKTEETNKSTKKKTEERNKKSLRHTLSRNKPRDEREKKGGLDVSYTIQLGVKLFLKVKKKKSWKSINKTISYSPLLGGFIFKYSIKVSSYPKPYWLSF